jgi:hypothetical protein
MGAEPRVWLLVLLIALKLTAIEFMYGAFAALAQRL